MEAFRARVESLERRLVPVVDVSEEEAYEIACGGDSVGGGSVRAWRVDPNRSNHTFILREDSTGNEGRKQAWFSKKWALWDSNPTLSGDISR